MKIMKNLLLVGAVLMGSTTWLEAWICTGCNQNRQEQERHISLCQNRQHQYCVSCSINHQQNEGDGCPQCLVGNPNVNGNGNNLNTIINAEIQRGIRCYHCQNLFNTTDRFAINPEPCHHRICVTCAYTLLQNRGYSQRFANFTHRRNAPTYHDADFNDNIYVGIYGRRQAQKHRNLGYDNVVHERSQAHHHIAAQCPLCDRAFSQATCNIVHREYNNRAINFGQYIWHKVGNNNKERIINSLLVGGLVALFVALIKQDMKKQNEIKKNNKPIQSSKQSDVWHRKRNHYRRPVRWG